VGTSRTGQTAGARSDNGGRKLVDGNSWIELKKSWVQGIEPRAGLAGETVHFGTRHDRWKIRTQRFFGALVTTISNKLAATECETGTHMSCVAPAQQAPMGGHGREVQSVPSPQQVPVRPAQSPELVTKQVRSLPFGAQQLPIPGPGQTPSPQATSFPTYVPTRWSHVASSSTWQL
jgi:hypothetical protein